MRLPRPFVILLIVVCTGLPFMGGSKSDATIIPRINQAKPKDQNNGREKAQKNASPVPIPPSRSPNGVSPDIEQRGGNQSENLGNEWLRSFFSEVKWTDVLLVFVTGGQLWVGISQARIASQTREIAYTALGRPYVFFEFISHNFKEWREGEDEFWFRYKVVNYGASPAIIHTVVARAFFSRGPGFGDDAEFSFIHPFPESQNFLVNIAWNPTVYVSGSDVSLPMGDTPREHGRKWTIHDGLVVSPKGESPTFGTPIPQRIPTGDSHWTDRDMAARLRKITSPQGEVSPYLMGQIVYEDVFRRRYHVNFCCRGRHDGGAGGEGDAPYNERT